MRRILFLLGLFIGLNSCYKGDSQDSLIDPKMDPAIFEAKEFFETQFDPDDENLKTNFGSESGNSKRHTLEKSLDWQRAYTKEFEDGRTGVYVPVLYSDDNYYIKAKWASLSLSGLTYALIYEKEEGKKSVEIVTTFPDSRYLSSEEKPKLFSGIVYVEDWNGKFIKSMWHTNGEVFLLEANKKEKRSVIEEICEGSIDWYTCSYKDGDAYADCNYNYTEYYTYSCSGAAIGGGFSYYIPTGGGDELDTDVAEDCNCDICPVCGGCLESILKQLPIDDDGTDTPVPDCPACSCVPDVDATGLEQNAKADCIYNKLINGDILKDFIASYFPSSTTSPLGELNLTWTLTSEFGDVTGETLPIGVPLNGTYDAVEIRLSEFYINSSSAILVANTMLHEALHAKLIAEVYDEVGTTDFMTLYAYYQDWGSGNIDTEQEMEMLISYTGQMAEALQAFDQAQGTSNSLDFYSEALKYYFSELLGLPKYLSGGDEYNSLYISTTNCN